MKKYIIKRLLFLIPIMILISLISFFLIYLSPGDPVWIYLSQGGVAPTEEALAHMRIELGLDKPLMEQYFSWIMGVLQGDFGTSISTGRPVIEEIMIVFPNTLMLTALAMLLTILISFPLGILAAVKENHFTDYMIRFCTFVTSSLPGFFAALLLIYIMAVRLRWLPTISAGSPKGIFMPALTLAITLSAGYIRQIRAALAGEMQQEYIRMYRARGIKERLVLFNGALISILPSIVTMASIHVGQLLGGTAIIEQVCTYPGVGRMAISAILNRDYPMVQAYVLLMALVYVLINLAVDILHAQIDPRVKQRILTEESMHHKRRLS